jgi:hypothetical protein
MRREGQGSASISAVVVFLSALLALGFMATILPPVANVLSGFREGLRERGERGSELIRIYIHTANETELEPPIITIINGYDRESILTDYVVVARNGRILAAGKMGGSLDGIRIPAGARIDLTPADFGLSYGTFAALADEVKAIYIRTAEGNSFGSSYGPPPKINIDYQLKISQSSQHIIVIPTTTTRYNFTITGNLTLPTTGDAMVVKNVILVDRNGYVRGGVTAGNKWSDGSFDPNKIPDSLAAITRTTDIVPIGGYYAVPPFPTDFYCYYSQGVFSVYSGCDTNPRYIEMVEFYPVEYYMPGSPVVAVAYYARFGGETQTVYNPDLGSVVTITAQRSMTVQYGYGVPGVYTQTVVATYTSQSGGVTRTYTTTITAPVTVWQENNLMKYAPVYDPKNAYYNVEYRWESCMYELSPMGDQKTCTLIVRPPEAASIIAIKEIGFELIEGYWGSRWRFCNYYLPVNYSIRIITSSQTYSFNFTSRDLLWRWRLPVNLPPGDVIIEHVASVRRCDGQPGGNLINGFSGFAAYEYFWKPVTATATLAISGNFRNQVKQAIVNGTETLSGDAVAHLAGAVQGGQVIKVKAPLVLLNYIYGIAASPPAPPSGGGGGGGEIGASYVCTVDQSVQSIMPPPSDSGSSSSSSNQPLESISGGTVSNFSVQQNTVQVLRNVVCRPVTPSRSLPSPN